MDSLFQFYIIVAIMILAAFAYVYSVHGIYQVSDEDAKVVALTAITISLCWPLFVIFFISVFITIILMGFFAFLSGMYKR
jgi:hypothetical protein